MNNTTLTNPTPAPVEAHCTAEGRIIVTLGDGRRLGFPAALTSRLRNATFEQRNHIRLLSLSLHWPDVDEDISIQSLLELGYGE